MQTVLHNKIRSRFSFVPLIRAWEQLVQQGRPGVKAVYGNLLEKIKRHPELLEPIEDETILEKHQDLVDEIMTSVFPVTLSDDQDIYAVNFPFQYRTIYASQLFRNLFLGENGKSIIMPDEEMERKLDEEKIVAAYQRLLAKLYDQKVEGIITSVHPYKCPFTALDKYMELELDTRFIDVTPIGDLPKLPDACCKACNSVSDIPDSKELIEALPLSNFSFDGFVIVRVTEVTEQEVMEKIRNSLLEIHSFSDKAVFEEIQKQMQNLVGVPGIHIGLKPFLRVNDHLIVSDTFSTTKIMLDEKPSEEKNQKVYNHLVKAFGGSQQPLLLDLADNNDPEQHKFIAYFRRQGWKSAIICPLYDDKGILNGVLTIVSAEAGKLGYPHIGRIESALPLFKLALEKSQELLDNQVDRVIKEKFTAVQSAVEWKFTEAALQYLTKIEQGEDAVMTPIVFNDVYPLYGAIDIRNSSIERNNAIQQDLLEQLHRADEIVRLAQKSTQFPLLDEIRYKLDKYSDSVANVMFADEELSIQNFLKKDIVQLFQHLQAILPALKKEIEDYNQAVNPQVEMFYHHRREYEESITRINEEIARFVDGEQVAAQQIFPHYFERFVTDGVDFNVYIGQSISPARPFDVFYLKNLKIWQLSTLAKAAQLTSRLQKKLSLGLLTTQLILAHSYPISISFRSAERKFDVDGAYNIRYEIIKKRIDKVRIKETNERLTQPGTIAIVYSQSSEAFEYLEYIEFLKNKGLLKGEVERFELEELQGVSGLKGLRVQVNDEEDYEKPEIKQAVAAKLN